MKRSKPLRRVGFQRPKAEKAGKGGGRLEYAFTNGSTIVLQGLDKPARLTGGPLDPETRAAFDGLLNGLRWATTEERRAIAARKAARQKPPSRPTKPPKRAGLKRTGRLAKTGKRSRRERSALDRFRSVLRARSSVCEVCGARPTPSNPLDPHHVIPKSRTQGWPLRNDPDLCGLRACRIPCHEALTNDPKGSTLPRCSDFARRRIAIAFDVFESWRAGTKPGSGK